MSTQVFEAPIFLRPLTTGGNNNDGDGHPPSTTFPQEDDNLTPAEIIALLAIKLVRLRSMNRKLKRQLGEQ